MFNRYFKLAQMQGDADKHLFRGLVKTKEGHCLRSTELLLEVLKEIGLDPKEFGVHSLRSGGGTAVAYAGVPDCWFK